MKRKLFLLSLLADSLFLFGLAAIVIGIAVSGHVPLAVAVGGVEMIALGVILRIGDPTKKEDDGL